MNPGPTHVWKEPLLMMFVALVTILGMSTYMETFNAAASNTKVGFETRMHMVKAMVDESYTAGLANVASMANTIGMLRS